MRTLLVMLALVVSALAQEQPSAVAAACGPRETFEVKLDQSQHTVAQPDPGKARVYFVQDVGAVNCLGACGAKIGLDGAWAGANKQNSYFSVSVEPGEHHLCASTGPQFSPHTLAFAHFTAEAGKVYYFRVRPFSEKDQLLNIEPIDSDEARFLIASYPLSESHPKP
jgi:uncharacterized protein DUF2846